LIKCENLEQNNQIDDISPLDRLITLKIVDLQNNQIKDLLPLVLNTGFGDGDEINVGNNPLRSTTHATQIPALQRRKIRIWPSFFVRSSSETSGHAADP